MILETFNVSLAVCRLEANATIPEWAIRSPFFSVTKTAEELSIVCPQSDLPAGVKTEPGWRCFKVRGVLNFNLTGILTSLANPLAQAGISIFAISTFDTDCLLVRQADFERAVEALSKAGHTVVDNNSS